MDNYTSLTNFISHHLENKDLLDNVSNFLEKLQPSDDKNHENEQQTERWLTWAKSQKHLKIVTVDVPSDILPAGWTSQLLDGKVFCRRGPDDAIYDGNIDIRNRVARGNCFLQLTDPHHVTSTTCVIYGLKKFTGGLGDDDDKDKGDDVTWKMYFIKPFETACSVISTVKVNGEAGHISARCIAGEKYWLGGSKNVHMLFRNKEDLEKYDPSNMRYSIAKEICSCWLDILDAVNLDYPDCVDKLHEFLTVSQLTAIFEFLNPDHPHVEDLSSMLSPQLTFITWSMCDLEPSSPSKQLCLHAPDVGIEIAKAFHLSTVKYSVVDIGRLDEHLSQIRQQYNKEGEVLFFLDEQRTVIGLLKKKSVCTWKKIVPMSRIGYIITRAIREKIRGTVSRFKNDDKNFSFSFEIAKVSKRVDEIQKWLLLDEKTVTSWKALGSGFIRWVVGEVENGRITPQDLNTRFPVHWQQFLVETNSSDNIRVTNSCSRPDLW